MISRPQNWRQLLMRWASSQVGRPFVWGETNCVALALAAIDAQSSTALLAKYRHNMSSEVRALAWSRSNDIYTLAGKMLDEGMSVIGENYVDDGDILLIQKGREINAHVYVSGRYLSSTADGGVRLFAASELDSSADGRLFRGVR